MSIRSRKKKKKAATSCWNSHAERSLFGSALLRANQARNKGKLSTAECVTKKQQIFFNLSSQDTCVYDLL